MLTLEDIFQELKQYCDLPNPATVTAEDEDDIMTEDNYENFLCFPEGAFDNEPYTLDHGVTKVCIIFENLPYVIKIPFMGYSGYRDTYGSTRYTRESCKDIPTNQRTSRDYYYREHSVYYRDFFADNRENWDYCSQEVFVSCAAEEAGLLNFFAAEYQLGDINGYPIYAQEKVEVYNAYESTHETSEEMRSKLHTVLNEYEENSCMYGDEVEQLCEHDDWLAQALAYHGEEAFKNFLDFISEERINDLHAGNIGYIGNRPVLLDYSGYQNYD